MQALEKLLSS